ncbi:M48 family metallopeptidase [Noviherbaspirillum aridicola]|uniref:Peptidase M48 domain-containing protein n=1 Tax=Noviherbaspirillum aridicola TaxID=2849687 RepID=A0ABQ4Q7V8_9BURK|nr:M48 family metallopeptidase [Noviherbaspirillum aridicola]GIZ53309.1 hypothetical protein NCCP691_33230 [Noviherbaspirillum aridicola]
MNARAGGWRGRLFGPGCADAGSEAHAAWRGGMLEVGCGGRSLAVPAPGLRLEAAGFNGEQLRLGWTAPEGSFELFIESGREDFLAAAPPALAAAAGTARAQRRRIGGRFRAALLLCGLILLLPFVALGVFFMQSDRIAAWAVQHVPRGAEERLGDLVLAQTRARVTLREDGPAHAAVQQLGRELSRGSAYRWRWFVAEDRTVNAFAAPGGVVVVNTGLIEAAAEPGELAGVLAHEIAHVEERHSLEAMVKSAGLGLVLSIALGDWSGSAAGAWAARLAELKFSRDAETEADARAVRALHDAGLSPQPMARFFGRLAENEARIPGMSLVSSHPPSAERMTALQEQIAQLPARDYREPGIDWQAVRASLPRAQQAR